MVRISTEKRLNSAFILLVFLFSLIVFINSINNEFTFKTVGIIQDNESIRSFSNIPSFFLEADTTQPSPLTETTFAVDYSLWGERAQGFRLTNILLHALASILVFIFASAFIDKWWALFAALVFAVHPVHTEPVTGIAGRGEVLATVLMLLSLRLFSARGSKLAFSFSLIAFLFALLSSKTAVVLPFLLVLYSLYFMERKDAVRSVSYFALLAGYLVLFYTVWWDGRYYFQDLPLNMQILTSLKILGIYIKLLFFPAALNAYYFFPPLDTIFTFEVIMALQAIVLIIALSAISYRYSRALSFSLSFILIALLPSLHILPHRNLMSESFLYLATVSSSILVATIFQYIATRSPRGATAAALLPVIIFSVMTVGRNMAWKDNFSLLEDTVVKSPESTIVRYNMGVVYYERGMLLEALKENEKAIELNPRFAEAYYNAAGIYSLLGDTETGLKALKWAVATGFKDVELLKTDPDLDNLRGKPGFGEIIRAMEKGVTPGH